MKIIFQYLIILLIGGIALCASKKYELTINSQINFEKVFFAKQEIADIRLHHLEPCNKVYIVDEGDSVVYSRSPIDINRNVICNCPPESKSNLEQVIFHTYREYPLPCRNCRIVDSLQHDKSITELVFIDKNIVEIPRWITQLPKLKTIDLSNNNITEIPRWLNQLPNLEKINLSGNKITEIPNSIVGCKQLKVLDLGLNRIYEINCDFTKMPALKHISLKENKAIKEIPTFLDTDNLLVELPLKTYKNVRPHEINEYLETKNYQKTILDFQ